MRATREQVYCADTVPGREIRDVLMRKGFRLGRANEQGWILERYRHQA